MIRWHLVTPGAKAPLRRGDRFCTFRDEDHQDYLLPWFDVGGPFLDPYGDCEYATEDLTRLRKRLSRFRRNVERFEPGRRNVVERSVGQVRYLMVDRDEVLRICDATIALIDEALRDGRHLRFEGD